MTKDLLLAIDNGTQSARALLFDPAGALVAGARVPLDGYAQPRPGWHEHDAEGFWEAVCAACARLWREPGADRTRIAGVGVTAQRGTLIAVDEEGRPLRPAITWLDQRKSPWLPPLPWWWRVAFRAVGVTDTVTYLQREAEVNWLRACEPGTWERARRFLLVTGWLNYRLTGRYADSVAGQVGYLPFDFRRLRWAGPLDWKRSAVALPLDRLPALAPPGAVLGEVTAAAAEATGIPAGLPVVAAGADKACEVLGAGCLTPEVACLGFGTTATINTTRRDYVEATRFVPPYPAAVPGGYSTEVQIFRGYWMVNWFKQEFGQIEREASAAGGVGAEALFDRLVAQTPPGAMGLMLQPFWTPGLKDPGPHAKGAMIGFGDVHNRAHVYRAILEGLAYALREGKERIERRGGVPITALRVAGGGARSDAAMQVTADVFGLPASRLRVGEASGLGCAIDVAVGVGLHRDFPAAVAAMTGIGTTFEPRERHRALYDELYRRVYLRLYSRLEPLYREIRSITGYPAAAGGEGEAEPTSSSTKVGTTSEAGP